MRTYTVAKHYRDARNALNRFNHCIVCADAEALVSGHPAKAGLLRCRELGEFLKGLMIDIQMTVLDAEDKRKAFTRQRRRVTVRVKLPKNPLSPLDPNAPRSSPDWTCR